MFSNFNMAASRQFISRLCSQTAAILPKYMRISCGFWQENAAQRTRWLHTAPLMQVKQIRETVTGNVTVIEGINLDSDRLKHVVHVDGPTKACPLCRLDLDLEHTDVLILSQFVRGDGCLLSRRVTGLCEKQHKLIKALVAQAQKAGLMPNLTPWYSHKDPKKRYKWKKFNRYFVPEKSGNKTKRYM